MRKGCPLAYISRLYVSTEYIGVAAPARDSLPSSSRSESIIVNQIIRKPRMCQNARNNTWLSRFQFLLRLLKHFGCTAPTYRLVALADLELLAVGPLR